jgi:Kef-type K+ transport system membrane component KefB
MERVSLPIYVAFFAITGASMNMEVLRTGWLLGLVIVGSRTLMIFIGTYLSGKAAGEEPKLYKNAWLGFLTQAGVSLGLVAEVVRRFPEIGLHVQSILVAAITLNQIIGPAAFKFMLNKVGETKAGGVSE